MTCSNGIMPESLTDANLMISPCPGFRRIFARHSAAKVGGTDLTGSGGVGGLSMGGFFRRNSSFVVISTRHSGPTFVGDGFVADDFEVSPTAFQSMWFGPLPSLWSTSVATGRFEFDKPCGSSPSTNCFSSSCYLSQRLFHSSG